MKTTAWISLLRIAASMHSKMGTERTPSRIVVNCIGSTSTLAKHKVAPPGLIPGSPTSRSSRLRSSTGLNDPESSVINFKSFLISLFGRPLSTCNQLLLWGRTITAQQSISASFHSSSFGAEHSQHSSPYRLPSTHLPLSPRPFESDTP
jgi:hypothetical protein